MPGDTGDDYISPDGGQLITWGQILNDLIQNEYSAAAVTANLLDYDLIQFLDTSIVPNRTYYMLKNVGSNYWGTYLYNPNFCRSLVIQSPHPKKDYNTGKEGIHIFHETESLFFMLSGTSRCNQSAYSSCSGTTSVCSDNSERYRITDLAHNLQTVFQNTTDTLLNSFSDSYFLQLHGFGKRSTDPFIILSNGTQITPTIDYISILEQNMENEHPFFEDSIKVAHTDLSWTRLRGFGNVQGRLINASSDYCSSNATATNGRFIHMEQEKTLLRDNVTGWNKVSTAITQTFPCFSDSPLPIRITSFEIYPDKNQNIICQWSVSAGYNSHYFDIEYSYDATDWNLLTSIKSKKNTSTNQDYLVTHTAPYKGLSYYRLKHVDHDGHYLYSNIKSINTNKHVVEISPNPANNMIRIKSHFTDLKDIHIYNLYGQDITSSTKQTTKIKSEIILDISNLKNGLYFIKSNSTISKVYKQ